MWPFNSSGSTSATQASCPVDHLSRPEEDGRNSVHMANRLPTDRVISSIPRYRPELNQNIQATESDPSPQSACPVDQQTRKSATGGSGIESSDVQQNWIYPSPSQFYDALKRKKREPRAEDMYTVVPIHNAVNERVWTQVLEWEAGYGRGSFDRWPRSGKSGPMLCSFRGRPDDLSPRAWIKVLSGYQAPFDRHDWEVIRPTEEKMRYVVDFYPGRGADSSTINPSSDGSATGGNQRVSLPNLSFYLDVRPALDNWEGVRMRLLRAWDDLSSGLKPSPSPPQSDKQS